MPLSDLWANDAASSSSSSEDRASRSCNREESEESNAVGARDGNELAKLKRQQQTAKARVSSLLSRQRKKILDEIPMQCDNDRTADFQHTYFSSRLSSRTLWWNPLEAVRQSEWTAKDRRRAVWLYFSSFASAVRRLFLGHASENDSTGQERQAADADAAEGITPFSLVLSLNVADDTNIKMGDGQRGSSDIRSILSNIQHHIVFRDHAAADSSPTWFFVHQPIVSLARANAQTMCEEFRSWLLSFCGIAGQRWQKWGILQRLFRFVKSHILIFISDALKANDALFRALAKKTVDASKEPCERQPSATLVMHVHCLVHQAALVRRTLALGIPGFWSNLVRLGHLFESHNFRQRFQAAMSKVICDSFDFVVCEPPEEAEVWRQLTIKHLRLHSDHGHTGGLRAGTVSRRMKAIHRHMLKDNGNPRGDRIVHFCSGPSCCASKEQALTSLLASFGEMFAYMGVPLLYRWKHCTEACNFVRDGQSDKILEAIDALRQAAETEADTTELSQRLSKQLTLETTICVVDFLLQPLDAITNKMLRRTTILKKLRYGDIQNGETLQDLKTASAATFMDWATGELGNQTLRAFLRNLQDEDLAKYCRQFSGASTDMNKTCFQLTVFGLSDTWRRFCLPSTCFPWTLFQLASASEADFCSLCAEGCKVLDRCPRCVDPAFSALILSQAADLQSLDSVQRAALVQDVQNKLHAISVFCTLASDTVENLHGQNQFNLHSWRGKSKATPAAAETSVLKMLASEHAFGKSLVHGLVMPAKSRVAQMMRRIGVRKRPADGQNLNHKQRLYKAGQRKQREISPWNVYLRENLRKCKKKLKKDEYGRRVQCWGRQWHRLPQEEWQNFKIQAEYEQRCREELATRPLQAGNGAAATTSTSAGDLRPPPDAQTTEHLEITAGERFRKLVSARRLAQSNESQGQHGFWQSYGLGLQDKDGAIARNRIEFDTTQETVDAAVHAGLHANLEAEPEPEDTGPAELGCKKLYGYCATKEPFHERALTLARAFAKFTTDRCLSSGTLVKLRPVLPTTRQGSAVESEESLERFFFLGVHCRRPLLQVFVTAWPSAPQPEVSGHPKKFSLIRPRVGALPDEALHALPSFATCYEVFRLLAAQCNGKLDTVSVDIFDYVFENGLWDIERLEVTVVSSSGALDLPISVKAPAKQKVELPFGLKPAVKKRKSRQRPSAKPKSRSKAKAKATGRGGRSRGRHPSTSSSSSSSSDGSDASSSDSSSSDSSDDDDSDDEKEGSEFANDAADTSVAMPNAAAAHEAVSLQEAATEFRAFEQRRAELAEGYRTGGRTGSYFVREIGFDEGSVAPTYCQECLLSLQCEDRQRRQQIFLFLE
ncbi:unnamed protein product [Symbiodinium sp. CCMP2592]|nr:unnamed protein product [Symbiodinium sp. CCMP2592]